MEIIMGRYERRWREERWYINAVKYGTYISSKIKLNFKEIQELSK